MKTLPMVSLVLLGSIGATAITSARPLKENVLFDNVAFLREGLLFFDINGKGGIASLDGQCVRCPSASLEWVMQYENGMAPAKFGSKWGIVDHNGEMVVAPRFDDFDYWFNEGLATVRVGNEWFVVDSSGMRVIEPEYGYVDIFSGGIAWYAKGGVVDENGEMDLDSAIWGLITNTGKILLPARFDEVSQEDIVANGVAWVRIKNKWGLTDAKGKIVVEPEFDSYEPFSNGLGVAGKDGEEVLVNQQGEVIFQADNFILPMPAEEPHEGIVAFRANGRYGFVDHIGDVVIEPRFDNAGVFREGLAPVAVYRTDDDESLHWGYIDRTGETIVEPEYLAATSFFSGLAWVEESEGLWTALNRSGTRLFSIEAEFVDAFREGVARFSVRSEEGDVRFGGVDRNGKVIIPPIFGNMGQFYNGVARVALETEEHGERGVGVIRRDGSYLVPTCTKEGCSWNRE